MTDLEMTKNCAVSISGHVAWSQAEGFPETWWVTIMGRDYNPIQNDAQAMELVKKFELNILRQGNHWTVLMSREGFGNTNLNRAIVGCVARMKAADGAGKPKPECAANMRGANHA